MVQSTLRGMGPVLSPRLGSSGSGGTHDGAKITRNDPLLSSTVFCDDGLSTIIPLPKVVNGIDSAFYSDGAGLVIPAGKAGQYQCSAEIELLDYFSASSFVALRIQGSSIEPAESPPTIDTILAPIDGSTFVPKKWSVSGLLDFAEGDAVHIFVACEGTTVEVVAASLAIFRVPIGGTPICAEPVPMTLPGDDASGDSNGNDVSGPLDLSAGDRVTIRVNVTSSDYAAGFVGIYSPSLLSYGLTGYVVLPTTSFTGSFIVDADAADWYVFVQNPDGPYDAALDGDPMTYCVIETPGS